jgi:hypothetical protein
MAVWLKAAIVAAVIVVVWKIRARHLRGIPQDKDFAAVGDRYVQEIGGLLSSLCPNVLRERITLTSACSTRWRRIGWRLVQQPYVLVTVAIAEWTPADETREKAVESFVKRDLIPQTKVPVRLNFRKQEKMEGKLYGGI